MPYHKFDPKWRGLSRDYFFLGKEFCDQLKITRRSTSLVWENIKGEKIAYHENWHNHESTNYCEGFRLIVRKNVLCNYLKDIGRYMIFKVELKRMKSHSYRRDGEDYDRGTKKAYLLTPEGFKCYKLNLDIMEKAKKIIEKSGGERLDVLKKWIAHYRASQSRKRNKDIG